MAFTLPSLAYAYDALEGAIDTKTMEIHHTKHHQTYVDKLNAALIDHLDLASQPIESLLKDLNSVPESIRTAVRNHGGGHFNHSLYWQVMAPPVREDNRPVGKVNDLINQIYGDFAKFKEEFYQNAVSVFGSGWTWFTLKNNQWLIHSTPNQDSPIMEGGVPILVLDIWEHAYYLNYQNRRPDYVNAWWSVVNWEKVEELYQSIK